VILLADDLGYGDLGVQGATDVATPNIDRLAAEGVRLTSYYADHPVCSPSRAALLVGKYPQRFGFDSNPSRADRTATSFGLPSSERILPERLKELGYATAAIGKWHVGFTPDRWPTARGFDVFYGLLDGAMAYTPDGATGEKFVLRGTTREPMPAHTTEAFGAEAVSFIEANKTRPFLLYVPFNAVHAPLQSTVAYRERFSEVKDAQRRTYLAMLSAMDDAVGEIVTAIDRNGLAENTLIVFTSDNGGPTWQTTSSNGSLNGVKGLVLEGGIRVPAIFRWKGQLPEGRASSTVARGFDVTATALAVAGATADPSLDGVDLRPYLSGRKAGDAHKQLFWRTSEQGAVRAGQWKYVRVYDDEYLFDLRSDLGERNNQAARHPSKLRELRTAWDSWSREMLRPTLMRSAQNDPPTRAAAFKALVAAYVGGRPVAPKPLLYGGGPE